MEGVGFKAVFFENLDFHGDIFQDKKWVPE